MCVSDVHTKRHFSSRGTIRAYLLGNFQTQMSACPQVTNSPAFQMPFGPHSSCAFYDWHIQRTIEGPLHGSLCAPGFYSYWTHWYWEGFLFTHIKSQKHAVSEGGERGILRYGIEGMVIFLTSIFTANCRTNCSLNLNNTNVFMANVHVQLDLKCNVLHQEKNCLDVAVCFIIVQLDQVV